jgi:hypothetical protein
MSFTEAEEKLLQKCLDAAELCDEDSIWVDDELLTEITNEHRSFSRILIYGDTNDGKVVKEMKQGTKVRCMEPGCLIFMEREYQNTHIKLQVYY